MSNQDANRDVMELARKTAEVRILQRVSADINSTLDLDEICDMALRTMDELFEFHHANILLLEPDGNTLRVIASRGYENQAIGGRVQVGTGVIGIVAQKRQMMHVNNLGQQRAYAAAQRREMEKAGRQGQLAAATPVPGLANAETQIAIPLLIRGDLIGVFSIESPVPRSFGEHGRDLVSIIANQIASAIHNARLYEERRLAAAALQEANSSLEARVAERTAALERELRVAQALLSEARSRVEGPLLGGSDLVRGLRDAIARQARSVAPLLLTGAGGSGKEAVARAVHDASGRTGAFIFIRCGEITSQYRQGFQADAPRTAEEFIGSRFELASGGTLFFEAVHELPPDLQQALHVALEECRRRSSLGESGVPDARVITSTTHDLRQPPPGGFLPLFQVLSANRISVPPLVDRREDIPALVDHFVRRHARRLGKVIDGVSPDSMRRLEAYTWPGNIRELRTVIERAVLVSKSTILEVDAEQLNEGLAIGSYRLVSSLGAGGMGEVWLARHRFLVRPAAVKLIRPDVAPGMAREQLVRRFEREANVTAALRSPHTVQLYDFGVNDSGSFYYVMEYLDGLDLHRVVTRFGPQPAERVVMLLRQACRSLAEAHAHGLVHRDIKPANVFVTRLGTEYDYVKVLDFGVVKEQQSGQDATRLSNQGLVQGTPAFMPPEIVMGESRIDGRADLYSLACTAYWVLTGAPVFEATTPAQMLLQHVQTRPDPPSQRAELAIPKQLETILMKCLEKDPAQRPSSALELEIQLSHVRCEAPWTNERAQEWWEAHAPEVAGR